MEDVILTRIAIETELAKLDESSRVMILLIFELEAPTDWPYGWPPTYRQIGVYIGQRFGEEQKPLSEAAIRYRRDVILAMWQGKRGPLRKNHVKSPRKAKTAEETTKKRLKS
jgi:hypothetical protein